MNKFIQIKRLEELMDKALYMAIFMCEDNKNDDYIVKIRDILYMHLVNKEFAKQ